jgi:hypothetical protein
MMNFSQGDIIKISNLKDAMLIAANEGVTWSAMFLIAVFLLSGVVVKLVKEYFEGEGKTK